MAGDPSRRPSNDRIRVAGLEASVWIECGSCFGDGWHWPHRGRPTRKVTCATCSGVGRRQISALERAPHDRIVPAPGRTSPRAGAEHA